MHIDEDTRVAETAQPVVSETTQPSETKIAQPKDHKAKLLIWSDLSVNDMDVINEAVTADDIKIELARIFGLEEYVTSLKPGIVMDLYYYVIQFARDNNFNKEKTSTLFSIVKKIHEICTETPFGNVEYCYRHFRELLLCHAVRRPPFSLDIFSADDVQLITENVIDTYFRHFKMYKYVFTPLVRLDLSIEYTGLPPTPPPSEYELRDELRLGEDQSSPIEGDMVQDDTSLNATQSADQTSVQATAVADLSKAALPDDTESAASKELRELIRKHLGEELAKLKTSMEEQIKTTEETINRKLQTVERSNSVKGKGKKK